MELAMDQSEVVAIGGGKKKTREEISRIAREAAERGRVLIVLSAGEKSRLKLVRENLCVPNEMKLAELLLKLRAKQQVELKKSETIIMFIVKEGNENDLIMPKPTDTMHEIYNQFYWKSDGMIHMIYTSESAFG